MINKLKVILLTILYSPFVPLYAVYNRIKWRNNNSFGLFYNLFILLLLVFSSPFLFTLGLFLPIFIFIKLNGKIKESSLISSRNIFENSDDIKKSNELFDVAKAKFNSNEFNEALIDFDYIISKSELSIEAYIYRGMTLQKLGFYIDSILDFDKAIIKKPNEANLYFLRATSKLQILDLYSTRKDIEKAIHLNPNIDQYASYLEIVNILIDDTEMQDAFKHEAIENGKMKVRI